MISAFANTLKIPELRQRIIFTLIMVVIIRLGANITLPGVDAEVLHLWQIETANAQSEGGKDGGAAMMALVNVFSGGAITNCAIFALGIMPYISASIMLQLLTAVVPRLSRLAREEGGRIKINQYTRILTVILSIFQGGMLAATLLNPESNMLLSHLSAAMQRSGMQLVPETQGFIFTSIVTMTAGTLLLMWIGDQITERGIGNGISLVITVNIVNSLPQALVQVWKTYITPDQAVASPLDPVKLVGLIALLLFVVAGVIAITQAQRRISIQYAKRVVGRKVYGGQTQYLPLKVNYAGVMPIIFAQAIVMFPAQILGFLFKGNADVNNIVNLLSGSTWLHYTLSGILIFFFSYFWVATMFQPQQIAEDLKKNGGYIPGVRPGKPTADFLEFTMSRLTFAGALFLTGIFIIPTILTSLAKVPPVAAQFFGGTSILILVGVLLDIMRQVETHLIQRHYDGFLRKGRIRGRSARPAGTGGAVAAGSGLLWLYVVFAVLIVVGMTYFVYTRTVQPHGASIPGAIGLPF